VAHPNEALVRETFAASGRGDIDALRHQYFADGIRLHYPGRSPLAGDYDGVAQVLGFFGWAVELSGGTFRTELHDVVANDEHAVALFTACAGRADRQLEDRIVEIFHIRDGKAAEVWIYPADLYASDEFWS
jgi:ketosteroid isomerase-like protein